MLQKPVCPQECAYFLHAQKGAGKVPFCSPEHLERRPNLKAAQYFPSLSYAGLFLDFLELPISEYAQDIHPKTMSTQFELSSSFCT